MSPIFESEETTRDKLEKIRKSNRCAICGGFLNIFLDNDPESPNAGNAFAAFRQLAEGEADWKMLLCYGGVGNGKTHLCEASAISLYRRGIFCRVQTMAMIMRYLKECMNPESHRSYDQALGNICKATRLIIDDVGMGGSGSSWEFGQLEEIIVVRYRERLFTILTTNLNIKQNPDNPKEMFVPERIVSRFRDPDIGRIVLNDGKDYRRLK